MGRMAILYIINGLGHGGTEKQVSAIIDRLDRTRWEPHVCCYFDSSKFVKNEDTRFLDFKNFNLLDPRFWLQLYKLKSYCSKQQIKIIHTFFQDPTVIGSLLKSFTRSKLVIAFRDLGFWKTSWLARKMRFFYRNADVFVANSQAVKDHYIEDDHINSSKIQVVCNGLDLPKLPVTENYSDEPLVGIVANFNRPVKRVFDFIKMAAEVHKVIPECRFMLVGDGEQRIQLEKLAIKLNVDKNVIFTGRVSNPVDYIQSFAIGVLTSETEGLSNAVIEYMAMGKPVVATAVGGNMELIEDQINGFLLPVGDYVRMGEAVIKLLQEPDLIVEMGAENRKKVKNLFNMKKMVAQYQSIYEDLLKNQYKNASSF
jgi:L-malate glycosyltransferase